MTANTKQGFLTEEVGWAHFQGEIKVEGGQFEYLDEEAGAFLQAPLFSVVGKRKLPPGAVPNDYVSQGPYWWPDPEKPDGLPYVRRDGEINPEFYETDASKLKIFREAVGAVVLRARAGDSGEHAVRAGQLLRTWFLDPATRMNPNLRFAQGIPGHCHGRGIGLIDTTGFCFLLDEILRLPFNECWTQGDLQALKEWFSQYLDWFLESDLGREEVREFNNHGTWYDAQVACFGLFCGREDLVRSHLESHVPGRITSQIDPCGAQPHELTRTLSLTYSTYNLTGFAVIAQMAARVGLDFWHWESTDGRGIRRAIRWMMPYFKGESLWEWPQIGAINPAMAVYLLSLAAQGTDEDEWGEACNALVKHPWHKISNWQSGHGMQMRARELLKGRH